MKTVYFIRHGESESNAKKIAQGDASILTAKGKLQAEYVARRMAKISIDTIVSSPFPRAKETAEIIRTQHQHISHITFSDFFIERTQSSAILGKSIDEQEVINHRLMIENNFHIPGHRHSDEENFEDLRIRAEHACTFLEGINSKETLVISHGMFIRTLIGFMVFKESFDANICLTFMMHFLNQNTGITILKFDELKPEQGWKVFTWNDHAHLAEPETDTHETDGLSM